MTDTLKFALFNRFELAMTEDEAHAAHHQGRCDDDVRSLSEVPGIRQQLDAIDPDALHAELKEYGAWDDADLADHEQNKQRILWIAAGDICDGKND
jgi:folate-binding Fe-S cluster repair protein YgfZ